MVDGACASPIVVTVRSPASAQSPCRAARCLNSASLASRAVTITTVSAAHTDGAPVYTHCNPTDPSGPAGHPAVLPVTADSPHDANASVAPARVRLLTIGRQTHGFRLRSTWRRKRHNKIPGGHCRIQLRRCRPQTRHAALGPRIHVPWLTSGYPSGQPKNPIFVLQPSRGTLRPGSDPRPGGNPRQRCR